tara:strand:+ start:376 stop:600 length:225 start_codon:yes stop_codon:yes gene_type:complete
MNEVWNESERKFVRDNAGILTDKEGSEQLSRITGRRVTLHAWRKQRQKMGISKMPGRGICRINYKQDGGHDVLN